MTATTPTTLGRAFELYRRTGTSRSAIALVAANAIPLVGVLFFGWSLWTILVIFWVENGIVGLWNIPRILMARGSIIQTLQDVAIQQAGGSAVNPIGSVVVQGGSVGRAAMAGFFLVHYGIFWLGHGIFVFALPSFLGLTGGACVEEVVPSGLPAGLPAGFPGEPIGGFGSTTCASPFGEIIWSNVTLAAVVLFLSHGASFFLNYLGKREYLTTSAARQMFAPYARVVMLHVTIIFGAFLIAFLGAPIGALIVLVIVKTAFDLGLHLRQHGSEGPAALPAAGAA